MSRPDARKVEADRPVAGARRNVLRLWLNQSGRQRFTRTDRITLRRIRKFKGTDRPFQSIAGIRVNLELVTGIGAVRIDLGFQGRVAFGDVRDRLAFDHWRRLSLA